MYCWQLEAFAVLASLLVFHSISVSAADYVQWSLLTREASKMNQGTHWPATKSAYMSSVPRSSFLFWAMMSSTVAIKGNVMYMISIYPNVRRKISGVRTWIIGSAHINKSLHDLSTGYHTIAVFVDQTIGILIGELDEKKTINEICLSMHECAKTHQ